MAELLGQNEIDDLLASFEEDSVDEGQIVTRVLQDIRTYILSSTTRVNSYRTCKSKKKYEEEYKNTIFLYLSDGRILVDTFPLRIIAVEVWETNKYTVISISHDCYTSFDVKIYSGESMYNR